MVQDAEKSASCADLCLILEGKKMRAALSETTFRSENKAETQQEKISSSNHFLGARGVSFEEG